VRILIAEDDHATQRRLAGLATSWGYDVAVTSDGNDALAALTSAGPPPLAILNWMLPGVDGPEICRRVRAAARPTYCYIIMLTARSDRSDIINGLESGADEYLLKPFNAGELRARLHAGERIVNLEAALAAHAAKLQAALDNIQRLQGLLPICAYCKSIRDDSDYWHRVEHYFTTHTGVRFTHGVCPSCLAKLSEPTGQTEQRQPAAIRSRRRWW